MNWNDFLKEFSEKFNTPYIPDLIVGFSGIDPSQKGAGESTKLELTDEQLQLIAQMITTYVSKLKIHIDGNSPIPENPYVELKPSDIPHDELDGLLGGDENGYYHLTEVVLRKLLLIIEALMPDEDSDEIELPYTTPDHERLDGLKGGTVNEHYHFTQDQWRKLLKLLEVLFPDGAEDPVFPNPAPSEEPEPDPWGDPFGGLPAAAPPAWTPHTFPTNFSAWYGVHKMYFGDVPVTTDVTATAQNVLLAHMKYRTTTATRYIMASTDGDNWTTFSSSVSIKGSTTTKSFGENIDDYLLLFGSNQYRLYMLSSTIDKTYLPYLYSGKTTMSKSTLAGQDGTAGHTATCYSTNLDTAIFVSQSGGVTLVKDGKSLSATAYKNIKTGITVNPGCAVWLPTAYVFCIAGPDGTAISANGVDWAAHTEDTIPKNLRDLTWREDFKAGGCLFAWREEDRCFYASADGITWTKAGHLPTVTQVDTIAAVDYNPDLQWYCVIGGTSRHAFFSKDLQHWVATTVTNGIELPMGSVIWMPSTQKYILMPTEGTNYFSFKPADWTGE